MDMFFAKFAKQLKTIEFMFNKNKTLETCVDRNVKLCENVVQLEMSYNYMNYNGKSCDFMFTDNQKSFDSPLGTRTEAPIVAPLTQ